MEEFDIRLRILQNLYKKKCYGGKHTSVEKALSGIPGHLKGKAKWALNDMIRRNIVLTKPTGYGLQISLNITFSTEIHNFINKYDDILFQKDER